MRPMCCGAGDSPGPALSGTFEVWLDGAMPRWCFGVRPIMAAPCPIRYQQKKTATPVITV